MLGPIVIVLLVLLLAMMCFHAAHDGWDAAAEAGAICIAIATVLGVIVGVRSRWSQPVLLSGRRLVRGPPAVRPVCSRLPDRPGLELVLPLRR